MPEHYPYRGTTHARASQCRSIPMLEHTHVRAYQCWSIPMSEHTNAKAIQRQSKPHQPEGLLCIYIAIQTQLVPIQSTDCPAHLKTNWQNMTTTWKMPLLQLLLRITLLLLKTNWQKSTPPTDCYISNWLLLPPGWSYTIDRLLWFTDLIVRNQEGMWNYFHRIL